MSEEIKKKMLLVSAILFKNNVPVDEAKEIGSFIEQLQQENQQLKQKVEWYKKENKHNQEIIIKDEKVLDEIREYIEKNKIIINKCYGSKTNNNLCNDLSQILDKVDDL